MNKLKILYKTTALMIILLSFAWFYINNGYLNFSAFGKDIVMSFSSYSALVFFIGFITSSIATMGTVKSGDLKVKEYEKKLSTTSVDSSKDKSKIEALERKIATLEKALESKLEDK